MPFNWVRFFGIMLKLHDTNPNVSLLGTTKLMYEGLERWTDQRWRSGRSSTSSRRASPEILATRAEAAVRAGSSKIVVHGLHPTSFRRRCGTSWCPGATMTRPALQPPLRVGSTRRPPRRTSRSGPLSREIVASAPPLPLFAEGDDATECSRGWSTRRTAGASWTRSTPSSTGYGASRRRRARRHPPPVARPAPSWCFTRCG